MSKGNQIVEKKKKEIVTEMTSQGKRVHDTFKNRYFANLWTL